MLLAALLLAAPPPPSRPAREVVTTINVRAQVVHTCIVSPEGISCHGAAGQPPVRVVTTPRGVRIIEF